MIKESIVRELKKLSFDENLHHEDSVFTITKNNFCLEIRITVQSAAVNVFKEQMFNEKLKKECVFLDVFRYNQISCPVIIKNIKYLYGNL